MKRVSSEIRQVDQERKSLSLSHAKISGKSLDYKFGISFVTYRSNQRQEQRHSRETLLFAMGLLSPGKDEENKLSLGPTVALVGQDELF